MTVDYATENGTATAGTDYTATSGTLTFAPGETAKTVEVPVADDTVSDDGETLTLALSNPSGAGIWSEGGDGHGHDPQPRGGGDRRAAADGVVSRTCRTSMTGRARSRFRIAFSERVGWMNGRRSARGRLVAGRPGAGSTAAGKRVDRPSGPVAR